MLQAHVITGIGGKITQFASVGVLLFTRMLTLRESIPHVAPTNMNLCQKATAFLVRSALWSAGNLSHNLA